MTKAEIIEKLRDDANYYGKFGKQYLSNSDIGTLLKNPLDYGSPSESSPNLIIGSYFHTAILEPDKLERFKIIDASTRGTKKYKDLSDGEMCMLQHEVDNIQLMREKLNSNEVCKGLISGDNVEYEVPAIGEIANNMWKGKADIINHDEKLIIDLKTTSNIDMFRNSAKRYNYDSQAYIYSKLFGYEMLFIVIDKASHVIGIFDCSPEFYEKGEYKVQKASEIYDLFYNTEGFDPAQYFVNSTL
jgi:hypothetical protein